MSATYKATITDVTGTYDVKGTGHAEFDTLSTLYALPMLLKVHGKDGAPNEWTSLIFTYVPVDEDQKPTNAPSNGLQDTCTNP